MKWALILTIGFLILSSCSPQSVPTEVVPTQAINPSLEIIPTITLPQNTATLKPTPTSLPGFEIIPISQMSSQNPWLPELDNSALPTIYYYGFSMTNPPFDNVGIRTAFVAAIDRTMIVELANQLGGKNVRTATTYIPSEVLGRDLNNVVGIPFNPQRGQDLLFEAGYPNGEGFPEVTLIINESGGITSFFNKEIALKLTEMWKKNLNVNVKLESVHLNEWNDYVEKLRTDKPFIYRMGNAADYNDPDSFMRVFVTGFDFNYGSFSNTKFDALARESALGGEPIQRLDNYLLMEKILCEEEAAVIPIFSFTVNNQ